MQLLDCLCVKCDNANEKSKLNEVLGITKSVMAITIPFPTVSWTEYGDNIMVSGTTQEMSTVRIVLQNNLGLFEGGDSVDHSASQLPPFDVPQHRYAVPRLSIDQGQGLRVASEDTGVATTFIPCDVGQLEAPEVIIPVRNEEAEFVDTIEVSRQDLHTVGSIIGLTDEGEPNYEARRNRACMARALSTIWTGHTDIDDSTSAEWTDVSTRIFDAPNPTDSASGTISREEQINYSEEHNPTHWNLVKVTYNGSRYYLTYVCPPSADMYSTLRVIGGIHADDTPAIQEICVYNTEAYWRELRHMMHQQVVSLREVAVA